MHWATCSTLGIRDRSGERVSVSMSSDGEGEKDRRWKTSRRIAPAGEPM